MKKLALLSAVAALFVTGAYAQTLSIPQVPVVQPSDLFQDVVGGVPNALNAYATAAQISGVVGYTQYLLPSTAFSYTAGNSTAFLYLVPSGTLATGTVTLAANPSDGQVFTLQSTQTQTAITIAANTSINAAQTIASGNGVLGAVTALVANTPVKYIYVKAQNAWYRIQ